MNTLVALGLYMLILYATTYTQNSPYLLVETSSKETESKPQYLVVKKDDGKKMLIKLGDKTEYESQIRRGKVVKPERCLYTPKRGRQVHGFCVTGNANLPSWSWVPEHSICEYWIYGGCGGNINRFSSFDDCMKHCDLEKQVCPQSCMFRRYNPVCGSDGNTYTNKCELEKASCETICHEGVAVAYQGRCRHPNKCMDGGKGAVGIKARCADYKKRNRCSWKFAKKFCRKTYGWCSNC